MKFSLSWLKKHLQTDASLDEIVDAMVRVGLEVESVDNPAERLKDFTIGEVLEAEPHPDADKLRVCKVATRDGEKQIVCGAPNARAGIKVAYAPVGAYVAGIDVTLSKAKIRGVESFGMMCSASELELGDDHDGIIEAPETAEIGANVAQVLGANDPVIDFEVTPNRPDTNGVVGVARDLAAAGIGKLITPPTETIDGEFDCPQKIELEFDQDTANACPVFAGRYVRGVKNGPSPKWLQDQLRAIGLRPINALVDITNYISYDSARPLHVYDADKLTGPIRARLAREGETLLALDDKEYALEPAMCVIADDRAVLGLGGVMGGVDTGCSQDTTNVFIECAYFDPLRTAKTGRKTGIVSDARYRFERGIDPASVETGIEQATAMVLELCGGSPSAVEIAGAIPLENAVVSFPPNEVKRLTGIDVQETEMEEILSALGFGVTKGDVWSLDVPSWRPDIEGKADIVEEVVRIVGFDRLPEVSLPVLNAVEKSKLTTMQQRRRIARRTLAARGALEAVTWSFMDKDDAVHFVSEETLNDKGLVLSNPISSDLAVMRPSLLPNLMRAIQRNSDRGNAHVSLFEVAQIFEGDQPDDQKYLAACVRRSAPTRHWQSSAQFDVFSAKADALGVLESLGVKVSGLQINQKDAPAAYHPGRFGALVQGRNPLAYFGEIHPRLLKAMRIDGPLFACEILLENIPQGKAKPTKARSALTSSDLMPLHRDFAFVVADDVEVAAILKAVRAAEKKLLKDISVFDVYRGDNVDAGQKSVAIEVVLQPVTQTLTDKEIDAVSEKIIASVEKAVGAKLRA